jgi:hypothetical protein
MLIMAGRLTLIMLGLRWRQATFSSKRDRARSIGDVHSCLCPAEWHGKQSKIVLKKGYPPQSKQSRRNWA